MSGAPRYRVERVRPADVRDDLCRLWGDNLTVEDGVEAKFDWLYRDGPRPGQDVFVLTAGDGARVGTAGVAVRGFQLGDRDGRAGVLCDLAVDKAHRSLGPALALVREARAWTLAGFDVAYGFPNALAAGVFKRAGYATLGSMTRYARVLRHAGYAARVRELELARVPAPAREWLYRAAGMPWFAAVTGTALDVAQLARRAPAALEATRRLRLEPGAAPDPRTDALWSAARAQYGVVAHRTHEVLAWRFGPRDGRTWFHAVARTGGDLRAYAVVDRTGDEAHVRDLFGHKPDVVALLDLLPAAVYRTGARSLSVRYLGRPWLAQALTSRGFAVRPGERRIVVAPGTGAPSALAARITDAAAWHLTDFDEDI